MTRNFQSFLKVGTSNLSVMVLGVISTLIIPSILGPIGYGEWQTYVLYSSYVGLLVFGYNDGLYLKLGGERYEGLNHRDMNSYLHLLSIYLTVVSALAVVVSFAFVHDPNQKLVFIGVALTIWLQSINGFFILVNQATSRFTVYAFTNVIEKLVLVLLAFGFALTHRIDFKLIILFSIISKLAVLIVNVSFSKRMIVSRPRINRQILNGAFSNIKFGLPLTLSGIVSMLITGAGRFLVSSKLGVEKFGYYSLAFSVMSVVTQIIAAASVIMYPQMRNLSENRLHIISAAIDKSIEYIGVVVYLLYYPIAYIMSVFLPRYSPSIIAIMVIFPTLIYQSRITIVYNTFFKVLRLQRTILFNGLIALGFCLVFNYVALVIQPTLFMASLATLMSFILWNYVSAFYLYKNFNKRIPFSGIDLFSTVTFILLNMHFTLTKSLLGYLAYVTILLVMKRKQIKKLYPCVKVEGEYSA